MVELHDWQIMTGIGGVLIFTVFGLTLPRMFELLRVCAEGQLDDSELWIERAMNAGIMLCGYALVTVVTTFLQYLVFMCFTFTHPGAATAGIVIACIGSWLRFMYLRSEGRLDAADAGK